MARSMTLRTVLVAWLIVVLTGCASLPSPEQSPARPSGSADQAAGDWGPLAVVNEPANGDFARTTGTVRLEENCAMLEADTGGRVLLVWSAGHATWLGESQSVRYRNFSGDVMEVADGDSVVLGGSGQTFIGPEAIWTWDEWIERRNWLVVPHDSCRTDSAWGIGNITVQGE